MLEATVLLLEDTVLLGGFVAEDMTMLLEDKKEAMEGAIDHSRSNERDGITEGDDSVAAGEGERDGRERSDPIDGDWGEAEGVGEVDIEEEEEDDDEEEENDDDDDDKDKDAGATESDDTSERSGERTREVV